MSAIILIFSFLSSTLLVGGIRYYALRIGLMDVPNARSAHLKPIPRGGGLAFAIVIGLSLVGLLISAPGFANVWWALLGGGILVAYIGWLDDRHDLSARIRFVVQGIAAAWAVIWLGGLPVVDLGFGHLVLGWFGYLLAWLFIIWLINLYNFMDGIDGLAGGHAVIVAGIAALLLNYMGNTSLAMMSALVSASVCGFLLWNWPPARIFMGDVGSGLLGFFFAVIALASENSGTATIFIWFLLLGVFIVDTTATLITRIYNGEQWYLAHNTHAYQRAVRRGWSHLKVTITLLGVTVVLGGIAFLVILNTMLSFGAFLLCYALLLAVWCRVR